MNTTVEAENPKPAYWKEDFSITKKILLTFSKKFTAEDIQLFVDNQVTPSLEPLRNMPPFIRGLLRGAVKQHIKDFTDENFWLAVKKYRPDLLPLFSTEKGLLWYRTFSRKITEFLINL